MFFGKYLLQIPDTPLINNVMIDMKQGALFCLGHDHGLFEDFKLLNILDCIHREVFFRHAQQIVRYRLGNEWFQLIV